MTLRTFQYWLSVMLLLPILFIVSCNDDDDPVAIEIEISPLSVTIDENPTTNLLLGTVDASTNRGELLFTLSNQSSSGALSIVSTTGEMSVADASLFDFETNPTITAMVAASVEDVVETAQVTITLNNVVEDVLLEPLSFTIDENPSNGQVLGMAMATSDNGSPVYSIVNDTEDGAIAIDASTGELTVADSSIFNFEVNPEVRATVTATVANISSSATLVVNLNDLDEADLDPFILTFRTTEANQSITIPVNAFEYTYDYSIDWGDGDSSQNLTNNTTHVYAIAGDYQVIITGDFPAIFFNFSSSEVDETRSTLISIDQWGTNPWLTMKGAFADCDQVTLAAIDSPDLGQVTSITSMFRGAASFNGAINHWDVSNITDFSSLFSGANAFNQPLDNWDMSSANNVVSMFRGANAFNQDISNWDVSNVEEMSRMFQSATSFNQPLNTWDVSNVRSMNDLFNGAFAFNQPLNNWDVSRVENMERMFRRADAFNQDLNDWDMSSVFSIEGMFQVNSGFNGAIGDWDVSSVVNMTSTFSQATIFNQDISNWDVSSVTDMKFMFSLTNAFNQDISGWDVSNVRNMSAMFQRNVFNQDIGNWDVSSVTNMSVMFNSNTSFNQDLTGWDVNRVTNCANFRMASALVSANTPNFTNCTQ